MIYMYIYYPTRNSERAHTEEKKKKRQSAHSNVLSYQGARWAILGLYIGVIWGNYYYYYYYCFTTQSLGAYLLYGRGVRYLMAGLPNRFHLFDSVEAL